MHSCVFDAERYFLVWWPEENKTSVLPERDILEGATATVGKPCVVSYGKATYSGNVAAIGRFLFTQYCYNANEH